jgi:hypothetical protein
MKTFYELLFSFLIIRDVVDIKQHMKLPSESIKEIEQVVKSTRTRVIHTIDKRINKKVE